MQQHQQQPSSLYNQYHQHFLNHHSQQQQSSVTSPFINNKPSAFSPMISANSDQHHNSVLSPFNAYARIQQAIAANSTNNSAQSDYSTAYNPFHQFPFSFSQFVMSNTSKPTHCHQQQVKTTNQLLLINSSNGSPSSSDQNLSNSLSLDSSSSQHHHAHGSASSSSASSPNTGVRKDSKTTSNFNSPNSISDNEASINFRPNAQKSGPVNDFNLN